MIRLREVYIRWIGIFILAYVMTLVHNIEPGETLLGKYVTSWIYTAVYWNGAVFLFMRLRRKYPLIRQTPKRLIITCLYLVGFMAVADPILCSLTEFKPIVESLKNESFLIDLGINTAIALVIGSMYENVYFFDHWKNTIKLNEALKNQQIRTQFEVLQNQMSPHFLFNSLNTLTTLIAEDADIAVNFTEKLSEVYRYILQNREKELVELKEEVEFVKNYSFLLKMRYPENLYIDFELGEGIMTKSIPPLTLQILVENAIKHNVVSKSNPLYISIYSENEKTIIIKNNLQQKSGIKKSTKTGLKNIKKRYEYLGARNIDIITTADHFLVAAPLLDVKTEVEDLVIN